MRKLGVTILSLLILVSIVAGCSPNKPAAPDQSGGQVPAPSAKKDPVTLRVVYSGTNDLEKAWSVRMKERIEEKYPHIKIEYQYIAWGDAEKKLTVMLQANDIPDLIQTQEIANYVSMNALEPLDSYLARSDSQGKKSDFHQAALDFFVFDNKTYALPTAAIGYGLIVNAELLGKVGIKPEDIKTWDDLLKAARALTRDGVYGMGYASGVPRFSWRDAAMFAFSNGTVKLSDVDDANRKAYVETLSLYNQLRPYMPEAITAWTYPDMVKAYAQGQIAMMPFGSYFTPNVYPINPDIIQKSRVIPIPKGPSGQTTAIFVGGVGFGMFAGSKNKEAAWEVLQELVQPEAVAAFAATVNLPSRKDVTEELYLKEVQPIYPDAAEAHARFTLSFVPIIAEVGQTQPRIVGQAEMEVLFQKQMVQMLQGKLSPEEAYAAIRRDISSIKK